MEKTPCSMVKDELLTGLDEKNNVVNIEIVTKVLSKVEETSFTAEELQTTRLGKIVNDLRKKTDDPTIARRAKDLVLKWRKAFVSEEKIVKCNDQVSTKPEESESMMVLSQNKSCKQTQCSDTAPKFQEPKYVPFEPFKTAVNELLNQKRKRRQPKLEKHKSKIIHTGTNMGQNNYLNDIISNTNFTDVSKIEDCNESNIVTKMRKSNIKTKESLTLELEKTKNVMVDSTKEYEKSEKQLQTQILLNPKRKRRQAKLKNHNSKIICKETKLEQYNNRNNEISNNNFSNVSEIGYCNENYIFTKMGISNNKTKEPLALEFEKHKNVMVENAKECEKSEKQLQTQIQNSKQDGDKKKRSIFDIEDDFVLPTSTLKRNKAKKSSIRENDCDEAITSTYSTKSTSSTNSIDNTTPKGIPSKSSKFIESLSNRLSMMFGVKVTVTVGNHEAGSNNVGKTDNVLSQTIFNNDNGESNSPKRKCYSRSDRNKSKPSRVEVDTEIFQNDMSKNNFLSDGPTAPIISVEQSVKQRTMNKRKTKSTKAPEISQTLQKHVKKANKIPDSFKPPTVIPAQRNTKIPLNCFQPLSGAENEINGLKSNMDLFMKKIPLILNDSNNKFQHEMGNAMNNVHAEDTREIINDSKSGAKTYAATNPVALFESVYKRKDEKTLADRIAAFHRKQEKKQKKVKKILARREAKKACGLLDRSRDIYYKGIGVTDDEVKFKIPRSSLSGKLTKAEKIGGVRRVLKPSSEGFEVVDLPNTSWIGDDEMTTVPIDMEAITQSKDDNSVHKKTEGQEKSDEILTLRSKKDIELQAERNIIAELLRVSAQDMEKSCTIPNENRLDMATNKAFDTSIFNTSLNSTNLLNNSNSVDWRFLDYL